MSTPPISVGPLADRTTWAKQNPTAKVQPLSKPRRNLTEAEKATQQLASAQKRQGQVALNIAIEGHLQKLSEKYEELAAEHHVNVSKIMSMVGAATHYKKERAVTQTNAIVHFMAQKINRSELPVSSSIYMC